LTARLVRVLVLMAVLWTAAFAFRAPAIAAESIGVDSASIERAPGADGWLLSADFAVPLPPRLEEAVNGGVALYFVVDFELERPRWYWWDERVGQASLTYRLSYHALTRQYRLSRDGLGQSFASLGEAVRTMSRLRGWKVLEPDQLRPGEEYEAQVRMRLDLSQLPKPFQVSAITNREWALQAEWKRFRFRP
jgi:Domain of unknown function (DUF4390)